MGIKLYDSENCPCPSDCIRHGKCKECRNFHKNRYEQTYCEYLKLRSEKQPGTPQRAIVSGKKLRLLDYSPCAG